jgi:hypothetical protein
MTIAEKLQTIAENEQKVYDAGKQAEYDTLWDNLQQNGKRVHYEWAFAYSGWNDKNYNPKYPITPTNKSGMSYMFFWNVAITDTKVPITAFGNCFYAFGNCYKLKRIPKLIFNNPIDINSMFYDCRVLEEINVEGEISLAINLQWSTKLTKASITSIISALSSTTTGLTATFSKTAVNNAFATSEGAADGSSSAEWLALAGTKTNWTISLV